MHDLVSEHRELGGVTLSKDLARHMSKRLAKGKVAIITDRPLPLLSSVRKQWIKLIRLAQRERSSTLNHSRQNEITQEILRLQNATFSIERPIDDPIADICLATIEQSLLAPPVCRTLYVTCNIQRYELHMVTSWMPQGGLVVIYGE